MTTKQTGGPVYPQTQNGAIMHEGMTLRDWFAGRALSDVAWGFTSDGKASEISEQSARNCAAMCYQLADAMLEERDK